MEQHRERATDTSIEQTLKEVLLGNVVVCGGCACVPGLARRVQDDIRSHGAYGVDMSGVKLPP